MDICNCCLIWSQELSQNSLPSGSKLALRQCQGNSVNFRQRKWRYDEACRLSLTHLFNKIHIQNEQNEVDYWWREAFNHRTAENIRSDVYVDFIYQKSDEIIINKVSFSCLVRNDCRRVRSGTDQCILQPFFNIPMRTLLSSLQLLFILYLWLNLYHFLNQARAAGSW